MFVRIKPEYWDRVVGYLCQDFREASPNTLFPVAIKWKQSNSRSEYLYLTRNFFGAGLGAKEEYKNVTFRDEELIKEAYRKRDQRFRWFTEDIVTEVELKNRSMLFTLKR